MEVLNSFFQAVDPGCHENMCWASSRSRSTYEWAHRSSLCAAVIWLEIWSLDGFGCWSQTVSWFSAGQLVLWSSRTINKVLGMRPPLGLLVVESLLSSLASLASGGEFDAISWHAPTSRPYPGSSPLTILQSVLRPSQSSTCTRRRLLDLWLSVDIKRLHRLSLRRPPLGLQFPLSGKRQLMRGRRWATREAERATPAL